MKKKIAIIGECMIELSDSKQGITRNFGGDTLNTAVYLARLLNLDHFSVHYVTGLGTDVFSKRMLKEWNDEGVSTDYAINSPGHLPGLYYIQTDEKGERTFLYWRGESAAKYWIKTKEGIEACHQLTNFDVLYVSGISLAILDNKDRKRLFEVFAKCRANGGRVIFDNNYRPGLWTSIEETRKVYTQMLSYTDTAFLTLDDEALLWGSDSLDEITARCKNANIREVVIKRGGNSCLIISNNSLQEIPAETVPANKILDTTAAGDSFSAGYLAGSLEGADPTKCARMGHLVASVVIQYPGAIVSKTVMSKITGERSQ